MVWKVSINLHFYQNDFNVIIKSDLKWTTKQSLNEKKLQINWQALVQWSLLCIKLFKKKLHGGK